MQATRVYASDRVVGVVLSGSGSGRLAIFIVVVVGGSVFVAHADDLGDAALVGDGVRCELSVGEVLAARHEALILGRVRIAIGID